jgi:pimeloyl-ACP methyl ester carboxylesterase
MPLAVEAKTLRASSDGTTITYYDTGGDKPVVLLANGLGGPIDAWQFQVEFFRERYRLLSWDYRGLYQSARPPGNPPKVDIDYHVADCIDVLNAAGVERAATLGWSMGVQVALSLYELRPELVTHLVLVSGTFGRPLDTVAFPFAKRWMPRVIDAAHRLRSVGSIALRRASRWPETAVWLKRAGIIGRPIDEALLRNMVEQFGAVDLDVYFRTLAALGRHDIDHILEHVRVPALVIAGEKDAFTPRQLAQQMARRIPHGELFIVRGGTHYAAAEYPELVNLRIEKFFREHAYTPAIDQQRS